MEAMSRASVLVVDDDADFRSLVRGELIDAGYDVDLAAGADEGLQKLKGEDVDVLLLDLQMPGKNGCQLLREARQTGDNFTNSECPRQSHPQRAAQAVCSARGIFGVVELAEDLPRPFEKHPAEIGRAHV